MANEVRIEITADSRGVNRTISNVGNRFDRLSKRARQVGKRMSMGLTLPILAIGGLAIKMGADFEQAMNQVRAVSGATGEQFEALREQAKLLGKTTQFSASQSAEAMSFLAMAGFDANQVLAAMPATLQLAASGQLELANAADIVSNILTGYRMTTEDLNHANDVLVKTFTSTNTNLIQLGEAFKYVGPVAVGVGFSFESMAAAIGMLGNAGIQATMAGTALKGAITRLLTPTDEAEAVMNRLGVNVMDTEGNLVSFEQIIKELERTSASTSDMMEIFGQRAGPAMMSLVAQGSGAIDELTQSLVDSGGTAERIADVQMEGFNGAMKRMRSAIEGAAIAFVESGLLGLFEKLVDWVAKAAGWMANLPTPVLAAIGIFGALVAAIGPLLIILGLIAPAIPIISGALGALGIAFAIATGPIGLIVIAIAAAIAVGVLIVKNWDTIVEAAKRTFRFILNLYKSNWGWILPHGPLVKAVIFLVGLFRDNWDAIKDQLSRVWNIISGLFTSAWGWLLAGGSLSKALTFIKTHSGEVWTGIKDTLSRVWDTVSGLFSSKWGWILPGGTLLKALTAIVGLFRNPWDTIKGIWTTVTDAISTGVGNVVTWFIELPGKIGTAIGDLFSTIIKPFTDAWADIRTGIDSVVDWFKDLPGRIFEFVIDKVVTTTLNVVTGTVSNIVTNITGWAGKTLTTTLGFATGTVAGWITNIGSWIGKTLTTGFNWSVGSLGTAGKWIASVGNWVGKTLATGFNWSVGSLGTAGRWIANIGGWIGKTLTTGFNWSVGGLGTVGRWIASVGNWVGKTLTTGFNWSVGIVGRWVETIGNWFGKAATTSFTFAAGVLGTANEWIRTIISWFGKAATSTFNFATGFVPRWITSIADWIGRTFQTGLSFTIGIVPSWIKTLFSWIGKTFKTTLGFDVGNFGFLGGFQKGGIVPGARGQASLAILHGGERVIPSGQLAAAGAGAGIGGVTINIRAETIIGAEDIDELVAAAWTRARSRGAFEPGVG